MTATTMIILATMVCLFAAFAVGLAWAQHYARQLTAAPADQRRRRRAF